MLAGVGASLETVSHPHGFGEHAVAVAGIIGLAVGGSLLASAVVAWVVSRRVLGINVRDAVEALRGSSPLARVNQRLNIRLMREGDEVRVSAKHEFELESGSTYMRRLSVRLYTDVGRGGGFSSIVEPGNGILNGSQLAQFVAPVEGKAQFAKKYWFWPGQALKFEIHTFGYFRLHDRLIWTVEHISRDFSVVIVDARAASAPCEVKVNHHRRAEIAEKKRWNNGAADGPELSFDFLGEVLPFQGFELHWREDGTEAVRAAPPDDPAATSAPLSSA